MSDPLTAFMNRLKHLTKFALVGLAILLAVTIPLYQLFAAQSDKISTLRAELRWTRYSQYLPTLMLLLQTHEQAVLATDNGEFIPATNAMTTVGQINYLLAKVKRDNRSRAKSLHVQGLWSTVIKNWNQLQTTETAAAPHTLSAQYRHELGQIWNIMLLASDYAKLRRNDDPASIGMIAAMRTEIPRTIALLNTLRVILLTRPHTAAQSAQQSSRIRQLANRLYWDNMTNIEHDLRWSVQSNPRVFKLMNRPLSQLQTQSASLLKLAAASGNFDVNTRSLLLLTIDKMTANISLISRLSIHWLQKTLAAQLSDMRFWMVISRTLTILITAIIAFLFISMYRSLIGAIVERTTAEGHIRQVRDLYEALSQTNRLIAHRYGQEELFAEVCRIIVQLGHFDLATIVLLDSASGRIRPAASAGPAVITYLSRIQFDEDRAIPADCQPVAACMASAQPTIINRMNFLSPSRNWETEAIHAGLQSAAAFPLRRNNTVTGALVIYSVAENRFDAQFTKLLTEISNSVSFAMEDIARDNFRTAAEQALRDSEQRYHIVMEGAGDAIILTDGDGRIVEANRRAMEQLGYTREELMQLPATALFPKNQRVDTMARYVKILVTGRTVDSSFSVVRKDQHTVPIDAVESRVDLQGRHFVLSIFRDISERQEAEERIRYLAFHDALTGLPNRTLLIDRIEQAVREAQRRASLVGILFLDLDNFKMVNDTLGHDCGDELLQAAAIRIRNTLRTEDTLARLGGDEFIVLIPDPKLPEDVAVVSRKIIESMNVPFVISGEKFHITCSIGMSIFPRDGLNSGALLRTADEALYNVKKDGRNRAAFHTPEMHAAALDSIRMENDLREAIRLEQFVLHYQPVVNLQTGQIMGAEALIRWQHPERGLISPLRFIPLAEEKGLILALGEWVLRTACIQNRRWQLAGLPVVPIAVNLSALQCREPALEQTIRTVLADSGLAPSLLELEITEGTLMQQTETLRNRMLEIKTLGIRFSLDDFGTGYSSLSYLTQFPIDTLKIDRSFVRDMMDDPKDLAVVDTIVDLADNLQLRTVAEGVEKMEQVTLLKLLGCHSMQGYHFSPPVPAEQFAAFLATDPRLENIKSAAAPAVSGS
ncbi:MAG: putative bifunctional diguanylate cyclase/phosphodiesterase [Phycisphaerae bacterium]